LYLCFLVRLIQNGHNYGPNVRFYGKHRYGTGVNHRHRHRHRHRRRRRRRRHDLLGFKPVRSPNGF
jgi:hypothetical protein